MQVEHDISGQFGIILSGAIESSETGDNGIQHTRGAEVVPSKLTLEEETAFEPHTIIDPDIAVQDLSEPEILEAPESPLAPQQIDYDTWRAMRATHLGQTNHIDVEMDSFELIQPDQTGDSGGAGPCTLYTIYNRNTGEKLIGHFVETDDRSYDDYVKRVVQKMQDPNHKPHLGLEPRSHIAYQEMLERTREWVKEHGVEAIDAYLLGTHFDDLPDEDLTQEELLENRKKTMLRRIDEVRELHEKGLLPHDRIHDLRVLEMTDEGWDNVIVPAGEKILYYNRTGVIGDTDLENE